MSLRLRLVLAFGALISLLMVTQLWMVDKLSRDLSGEIEMVAFSMGQEVISAFSTDADHWVHDRGAASVQVVDLDGHNQEIIERIVPAEDENVTVRRLTVKKRMTWVDDQTVLVDEQRIPEAQEDTVIELFVESDQESDAGFLVLQGAADHRIPIPKLGVNKAVNRVTQAMMWGSSGLLVVGLLLAALLAHRITAPLRELTHVAQMVGNGAFGAQINGYSLAGEEGRAIAAFNLMSLRLKDLDEESKLLRQRQALSELGEVARGLAHTIRNPLNAIGLSMDELASLSEDRSAAKEIAAAGRRQIRRVDQWIRSFLALASDQGGIEEAPVQLAGLIREVVLNVAQDNPGKVEFTLNLEGQFPAIKGLVPELRAVFHALIVNAVEASPSAGRVAVSLRREEQQQIVHIDDDGPGIAQAVMDRLFTPHVTTKSHGSGMGLFLAQRIMVTKYSGQVGLQPRDPVGTRASVVIPERGRV